MNFGEKQRNGQEDITRPESFEQKSTESFENEEDITKLGEKRISELGSQETELKQGWQGRAEGFNKTIGLSSEKLNSLKERFGLNEKLASLSEKGSVYLGEAKTKIVEISKTKEFNQIADATPFVGGAKRVAESVYGKTLSGEELSGKNRLKHGIKGAVDLGLDFTGVGEVEKGAKMAYVGKKIATGLKDNPEAFTSLGKKIIQKKEAVADKSEETEVSHKGDLPRSRDEIENILPHNKLNNNENNMKPFETAPTDSKDLQSEKPEAGNPTEELRAKTDEMRRKTMEKDAEDLKEKSWEELSIERQQNQAEREKLMGTIESVNRSIIKKQTEPGSHSWTEEQLAEHAEKLNLEVLKLNEEDRRLKEKQGSALPQEAMNKRREQIYKRQDRMKNDAAESLKIREEAKKRDEETEESLKNVREKIASL